MKQDYDERLREVSKATVEAKMYGCGFIMLTADGAFFYVPVEAVKIDVDLWPERPAL